MNTRQNLIIGVVLAVGAALTHGIAIVLIKEGMAGLAPPLVGAAISLLTGTMVLGAVGIRRGPRGMPATRKSVLIMLASGVSAGIGVGANFFALSLAPVVVVTPIATSSPLFTLLFSYLFLGRLEKVTLRVLLGTILVIGGVVLIAVGSTH